MKIQLGVALALLCGLSTVGVGVLSQAGNSPHSQLASIQSYDYQMSGQCGTAVNMCYVGVFEDMPDTSTEHLWRCVGTSGMMPCSYPKPTYTQVNGECGSIINSCESGTFIDAADTDSEYTWYCSGLSGGSGMPCSQPKTVVSVVQGECGSTINMCLSGTFVEVADTSTEYHWFCDGSNGGTGDPCSLPKSTTSVNGQCGTVNNSCVTGTLLDATDTSSQYLWNCKGQGGGIDANCSTPKTVTTSSEYPRCPLTKPSNGYVLDFTKGGTRIVSDLTLYASNGESNASLSYGNVSIGTGVYRVNLATYWNSALNQSHPYQQWKLRLYLTDGKEIQTLATKDQNSATAIFQEALTTNLVIPIATKEVDAYHAGFPNSQENPVVPLCAALTYLGPITTSTTSLTVVFGQCSTASPHVCSMGAFSDVTDTATQYLWKCKGVNGGTDANCYLPKPVATTTTAVLNGQCNSTLQNGCISGTFSDVTDTTTQYIWRCKGQNGGTDVNCYIPKTSTPILVGVCGTTNNVCRSGAVRDVSDTLSEYRWICTGENGGTDTPCAIKKPIVETSSIQPSPLEVGSDLNEVNDTDTVETVRLEITDAGISGEYIETELPKEIFDARQDIVQQGDATPFTLLKDASPLQRETLLKNWFSEPRPEDAASREIVASSAPRTVVRFVREQDPEDSPREEKDPAETLEVLTNRSGLASINDRDGDGISDYDEKHIYGTDPEDPFTADSPLSDGERVLLGMDPQRPEIEPVVVESPRATKNVIDETLYAIETIELIQLESPEEEQETRGIRIRGTAQPLAFVTLYVYSTPIIVTVQADASGVFEYVLDTTLEDGTHEVYVASINNSGKILAQSNPIPFVKTAQAIEYTPASVSGADPVDSATQLMLTLTFLLTLLIAGAGIVWIGMRHANAEAATEQAHENNGL